MPSRLLGCGVNPIYLPKNFTFFLQFLYTQPRLDIETPYMLPILYFKEYIDYIFVPCVFFNFIFNFIRTIYFI